MNKDWFDTIASGYVDMFNFLIGIFFVGTSPLWVLPWMIHRKAEKKHYYHLFKLYQYTEGLIEVSIPNHPKLTGKHVYKPWMKVGRRWILKLDRFESR